MLRRTGLVFELRVEPIEAVAMKSQIAVLILIVVLGGGAPGFVPACAAQAASTTIK